MRAASALDRGQAGPPARCRLGQCRVPKRSAAPESADFPPSSRGAAESADQLHTSGLFHPPPIYPSEFYSKMDFFIFFINSPGNPVPTWQGGSVLPAPHISRARRERSIPGCSLCGQRPDGAAGSGTCPVQLQSTRTTRIRASSIPASRRTRMLSTLRLRSQRAQIPALPSHKGTATAPTHSLTLAA